MTLLKQNLNNGLGLSLSFETTKNVKESNQNCNCEFYIIEIRENDLQKIHNATDHFSRDFSTKTLVSFASRGCNSPIHLKNVDL